MNLEPDVTVVIPIRDAMAWLPGALASIGSNPDIEIIVVDDGSTDGTMALMTAHAGLDPRLRILTGSQGGPSKARNIAIEAARAPLIAFLDVDDRWAPGKLKQQIAFHRDNPDVGFSFTDYCHVTTSGDDLGDCFAYWPRFSAICRGRTEPFILDRALACLFAENTVGTSTVMARTDLLRQCGGFSSELASAEDWDLWMRLASLAPVGVIPTVLANYTMHRPGNMTSRKQLRLQAMEAIGARHRAAAAAQDPSALRSFSARLLTAQAEIAEQSRDRATAIGLRLRALARQPSRRGAIDLVGALRARHAAR